MLDIKKALDHWMYDRRLNQSSLSAISGVDRTTLNLAYNEHRLPSVATLEKLARACDVKVSEFIAAGE